MIKITDYLASPLAPLMLVALMLVAVACKARNLSIGLAGGAVLLVAAFLAMKS